MGINNFECSFRQIEEDNTVGNAPTEMENISILPLPQESLVIEQPEMQDQVAARDLSFENRL